MEIKKLYTGNCYEKWHYGPPFLIVNHITEGSYGSVLNWFMNPKSGASTHFVIARDGRVTMMVPLTRPAWGNGNGNLNYNNMPANVLSRVHPKILEMKRKGIDANFYTISKEHEGFYNQTKGALTEAQLKASIEVDIYIMKELKRLYGIDIEPTRDFILGHYQISPINKVNCPGQLFPFDRELAGIKAQFGMTNSTPVQKPKSKKITIDNSISGYYSAYNAVNNIKPNTLEAGEYFIYKEVDGFKNITKSEGIPGSWVVNKDIEIKITKPMDVVLKEETKGYIAVEDKEYQIVLPGTYTLYKVMGKWVNITKDLTEPGIWIQLKGVI